jgi:hypothetical protein
MLAMALPEPELAAQGACFGLEFHIIGLTSVTIAGFPGGAIALMADTGEVFHLLGAMTAGNRTANPAAESAFVFAEKGFVYGAGILGPVKDDGFVKRPICALRGISNRCGVHKYASQLPNTASLDLDLDLFTNPSQS